MDASAAQPNPSSQPPEPPDRQILLLELHKSEYEALTMRITYWSTLQYVTYTLAAAYLGFVAQSGKLLDTATLSWATTVVLLILGWALLQTQFEIATIVDYIDTG